MHERWRYEQGFERRFCLEGIPVCRPDQAVAMSYAIDKRRSPRIPCDLSVEYDVKDAPAQLGWLVNIGTTGALITTEGVIPPVGAQLRLRFHLPLSNRRVQTVGTVRWATPGRIGVEFTHLSLHEQDEIWRYYAKVSRERG